MALTMLYKKLLRPFLFRFDSETSHNKTLAVLSWAQHNPLGRAGLRLLAGSLPVDPVTLWGLTFPNVLGLAAGFDKEVRVAAGMGLLGFGHVEVGTLTPRPQTGNPPPRLFRLPADGALINRLGFPNEGVETAVLRLRQLAQSPRNFVLGVSLGKQKETPLAAADTDYVTVMTAVYPYADYLAVNISSPNTPGLRDLQGGEYLRHLLTTLMAENSRLAVKNRVTQRPLLVKIAPDLTWDELDEILDSTQAAGVDGIIATNTTVDRSRLSSPLPEEGGVSGRPLQQRSTELITYIARHSPLPVIGVGGIHDAASAREKLDAGASLIQLYTGLIYQGPRLPGHIVRQLKTHSVDDVV
jgi:dihydroorotate dehydrogenase